MQDTHTVVIAAVLGTGGFGIGRVIARNGFCEGTTRVDQICRAIGHSLVMGFCAIFFGGLLDESVAESSDFEIVLPCVIGGFLGMLSHLPPIRQTARGERNPSIGLSRVFPLSADDAPKVQSGASTPRQQVSMRTLLEAQAATAEGDRDRAILLYKKAGYDSDLTDAAVAEMDESAERAVEAYARYFARVPKGAFDGGIWVSFGKALAEVGRQREALDALRHGRRLLEHIIGAGVVVQPNVRSASEVSLGSIPMIVAAIDARRGLRMGCPTAFEEVFVSPPLKSSDLAKLTVGLLDLEEAECKPLGRTWLTCFESVSNELYDPRQGDSFAWELEGEEGRPPGGFSSWLTYGRELRGQGKWRLAIRAFAVALEQRIRAERLLREDSEWLSPEAMRLRKSVEAIFSRPPALEQERLLAEKLEVFTRENSAKSVAPPEGFDTLTDHAQSLFVAGKPDEALKALVVATDQEAGNPNDVEALKLLVRAYIELGRKKPACYYAQRTLTLAPTDSEARRLAQSASRLALD